MPPTSSQARGARLPYRAADLVWIGSLAFYGEGGALRVAEHAPFHGPFPETCPRAACVRARKERAAQAAAPAPRQPWEPRPSSR